MQNVEKVCCKLGKKCSKSFTRKNKFFRFLVNFLDGGVKVSLSTASRCQNHSVCVLGVFVNYRLSITNNLVDFNAKQEMTSRIYDNSEPLLPLSHVKPSIAKSLTRLTFIKAMTT
jgi:hypothetical protein